MQIDDTNKLILKNTGSSRIEMQTSTSLKPNAKSDSQNRVALLQEVMINPDREIYR